jgi:hypothetical protein
MTSTPITDDTDDIILPLSDDEGEGDNGMGSREYMVNSVCDVSTVSMGGACEDTKQRTHISRSVVSR